MSPPWATCSLGLRNFGHLLQGPAPVWLPEEPSDLSGLDADSPPWLCAILPFRVFLGRFTYIIQCAFIVYLFSDLIQFFFFCLFEYSALIALFIDQFPIIDNIVQLMLDYCSLFW
jgi:hypothetical protein